MKTNIIATVITVILLFTFACSAGNKEAKTIKISDDIELIKLSKNIYVHTSLAEVNGFGMVSSNGMIVLDGKEAYLFDTPMLSEQTETLENWIESNWDTKITTFVPNHWHDDCMAGIEYLHSKGVKSYANEMTIDIAREKGLPLPQNAFKDSLILNNGNIECYYLGAGHALDNIVVWIPAQKILFAGCMAKDKDATNLGNIADGNLYEWSETLSKVQAKFASATTVIPGHGAIGDIHILEHTRQLCIDDPANVTYAIIPW